jgi:hypothetical protein
VAANDKQRDALLLRKQGMTYEAIADTLGYASPSGAYKAILSALQRTLQEPADDLRTLEGGRLDAMLEATWGPASRGIPQAVDRVLRILERRAKLYGLDAPVKQEITGKDGAPVAVQFIDVVRPEQDGK